MEPNPENTVHVEAVWDLIYVILPWQLQICELVHYCDKKALFSKWGDISSWFRHSNSPVMLNNILLLSFTFFQVISEYYATCTIKNNYHHLSSWWNCICFLWCTFTNRNTLFGLSFCLWCVVMDPCVIDSYETMHKFLWIMFNSFKRSFETFFCSSLSSSVNKCGTHLADRVFICKYLLKIVNTAPVDMPAVSAFSHTFTLWSVNKIS